MNWCPLKEIHIFSIRLSKSVDFKTNPPFLDHLAMEQTAKMVMKVEQKVLRRMNLMSRHKVLYNSATEKTSIFFGHG